MRKESLIFYLILLCGTVLADVTVTEIRPTFDTFVLNPGSGNIYHTNAAIYNYGGAGSRCVASSTAYAYLESGGTVIINDEPKGEFISLLKLDFSSFAGAVPDELVLKLYISNGNQSAFDMFNYIGSAGNFDLSWITNDWSQGTGAPHETPSNSLNGISYAGLQELLYDEPPCWIDMFYYTAENPYGSPQWFEYRFDFSNGYYADLLDMISLGKTITFMLSPSKNSYVCFNFSAYVQLSEYGANLRPEGPKVSVATDDDLNDVPQISNCYTDVVVSGLSNTGGLIGYNACRVQNCYASGSIDADISDPNCTVGGLFGQSACDTDSCYWNVETSGISTLADAAAHTTSEMMTQSSFVDWDFSSDDGDTHEWMMLREGEDYPRLTWQPIITGDIAGLYGVDIADSIALAGCWLDDPYGDCAVADIDGDAFINLSDFAMLAANWLRGI